LRRRGPSGPALFRDRSIKEIPVPTSATYTFRAQIPFPIDQARAWVEAALRAEGFGILTEIDVAATLQAKLGLEVSPYLILGACNPRLAHAAIEIEPSIGALLPCNVVLRQAEDAGETVVEILDPEAALGIADSEQVAPIAAEAAARLRRVLAAVVGDGPAIA
jgi:uncharacterized protein (DUF302 family)